MNEGYGCIKYNNEKEWWHITACENCQAVVTAGSSIRFAPEGSWLAYLDKNIECCENPYHLFILGKGDKHGG